MTQADIVGHVQKIEADLSMGDHTRTAVMQELFDHALTNGEAWPDQFVVDLLKGRWGSRTRLAAAMTIEDGLKESGQVYSFVRFCIAHRRLSLLSAVADLGLKDGFKSALRNSPDGRSTTNAGAWLDVMANVGFPHATSFPRQICAYANSATGAAVADILVRHDPSHGDIPSLTSAGGAVFTAALMRNRIDAASSAQAIPSTPPATPARRRMGL